MIDYNQEEVFRYLFDLRESGIVNMWSSPAYLQERYGMDRFEAREWLFKWMDYYHESE
jgi:hypothetical protein